MTYKKANRLVNKIMKEECSEVGVFITYLSKIYMMTYDIDDKDFLKSLKKSLEQLKKEDYYE